MSPPTASTPSLESPSHLKSNNVKLSQSNEDKRSEDKNMIRPTSGKMKHRKSSIPPPNEPQPLQSADDSSVFELDEQNLYLCVNQARQVVVLSKSKDADLGIEFENLIERRKRIVVILRDFCNENETTSKWRQDKLPPAAKALKEHLRARNIFSYTIGISGLLQDLEAIQAMKGYNPQMESDTAYNQLLLSIIQNKIQKKKRKVVILHFEEQEQTRLRPDELQTFCDTVCQAEVLTLDKTEKTRSASFQFNLEKLTEKILLCKSRIESRPKSASSRPKSARPLSQLGNELYQRNCPQDVKDFVEKESQGLELDQNANIIPNGEGDLSFRTDFGSDLEPEMDAGSHPLDDVDVEEKPPIKNLTDVQHIENDNDAVPLLPVPDDEIKNNEQLDRLPDEDTTLPVENAVVEFIPTQFVGAKIDEIPAPDQSSDTETIKSGNGEDAQDWVSLSDSRSSVNSNHNQDTDLGNPEVRVRARKKRRRFVPLNNAEVEVDRHLSILKLMSKSKSDSDSSDSDASLHLSLIFASRPKLFKICVTPDESRYPSALFTKFPDMSRQSTIDMSGNLYKGWIAVPTVDSALKISGTKVVGRNSGLRRCPPSSAIIQRQSHHNISLMSKVKPKLRQVGQVMKRVLRPIGNLFFCESCINNQNFNPLRRSAPRLERRSSEVYPGIMLTSDAFDQKYY